MSAPVYKIGLVGPTRVGKTSIISSVVADAHRYLKDTPVTFRPEGQTAKRVNANRDDLDASLADGKFNPGALAGTGGDPVLYELALTIGMSKLPIHVLDYPGSWLREQPAGWDDYRQWLAESSVLIVPVDSVVVMTASTEAERKDARWRLCVSAAKDAIREWARTRGGQPGTLVVVPVKCESYFHPISRKDRSQELYDRVLGLYRDCLEDVRTGQAGQNRISGYYMPIETIGGVRVLESEWKPSPDDGRLECWAEYQVVGNGVRQVRGAGDILVAVARLIAASEAGSERGFFEGLWRWLRGEDRALLAAIKQLEGRPYDERVRALW